MKYTKEERNEIGRLIYTRQLTIVEACEKYGINHYTARDYMRDYRDANQLPPMSENQPVVGSKKQQRKDSAVGYDELSLLSKEELINEVIKARVATERAKKGYAVKGGGQEKEFISLLDSNSK